MKIYYIILLSIIVLLVCGCTAPQPYSPNSVIIDPSTKESTNSDNFPGLQCKDSNGIFGCDPENKYEAIKDQEYICVYSYAYNNKKYATENAKELLKRYSNYQFEVWLSANNFYAIVIPSNNAKQDLNRIKSLLTVNDARIINIKGLIKKIDLYE